jgi:hypothetical protein
MQIALSKTAVLDDLAAQLAARRQQACERRLAYLRLARAIVSQQRDASSAPASRGSQPLPMAAAA